MDVGILGEHGGMLGNASVSGDAVRRASRKNKAGERGGSKRRLDGLSGTFAKSPFLHWHMGDGSLNPEKRPSARILLAIGWREKEG
ncbi:hypothetical protein PDE_06702 [Penicillium oxalicum 114-2]|uniref:Uncharacterized protein n=1 Tax=Penicillium oxalicum (strain 114-2 / CGMCC 5302) TaxID=933388 RepID=S7ZM59_PENO1|nr:hypothetical protein PDE_06702 [Penicillium oxalicum 114-2]